MDEKSVRGVLLRSWDPIGIGQNPHLADEYDDYVPEIIRLLESESLTGEKLEKLLIDMEEQKIGTTPNPNSIKKAAADLMALR